MPISSTRNGETASLQVHLDLLGRLHLLLGSFGVLTGTSLGVLALGTRLALKELNADGAAGHAGVGILAVCGALLFAGGAALILAGRALDRRGKLGRLAALLLAVPNLIMVPFGTALSVYSFWVLLNDEARREFGRPPRAADSMVPR